MVEPVLARISSYSIHPQLVTLCAFVTGVSVLPLLSMQYLSLALVLMLCSGYFDTLDGSLARSTRKASARGAVLDIVSDRTVEFAVICGLYLYDPATRGLEALLMMGSVLLCVTSFLVVGIFTQNVSEKSFHYSPGLIERGEAFLFFGVMIVFPEYFGYLAYLFSTLVTFTAFLRVTQFYKAYDESGS